MNTFEKLVLRALHALIEQAVYGKLPSVRMQFIAILVDIEKELNG